MLEVHLIYVSEAPLFADLVVPLPLNPLLLRELKNDQVQPDDQAYDVSHVRRRITKSSL